MRAPILLVLLVLALPVVAVPASAQSLADLAAKEAARRAAIKKPARVITDEDLPADKGAPAKAPPMNAGRGAPADPAGKQQATTKTDDNGHDERWWNARAQPLAQRLNAAARTLQAARARVEKISIAMNRAGGRARAAMAQRLQAATAEVERRAAELADARRALDDLEEEARKAGALPGWLRK